MDFFYRLQSGHIHPHETNAGHTRLLKRMHVCMGFFSDGITALLTPHANRNLHACIFNEVCVRQPVAESA
jgi:hypothetical protein